MTHLTKPTETPTTTLLDTPSLVNAFTVDVEDYFQVSAFEKQISRGDWQGYELRVEGNTRRLLEMLARYNVKATFFVLGWIAEHCPWLVEEIYEAGHEIGSHGYWHRLIYGQTPRDFRQDVRRTKQLLEAITGTPVRAFRAPSFSITKDSLWALQILAEEGHDIDSSIFPVRHDRYGIPGAAREIHRIETAAGTIWEVPPTVCQISGWDMPVGGGGYFRLYPLWWTLRQLRYLNATESRPFVFYIHPWEIDPAQPQVEGVSRTSRFRHRVNLGKTASRIERLLEAFHFAPLRDIIDKMEHRQANPATIPIDFNLRNNKEEHAASYPK